MDFGSIFGGGLPPGLDPETAKWLQQMQMMQMAAALMEAGAPSTDPKSGSLAYGMSQALKARNQVGLYGDERQNRKRYYDYLDYLKAKEAKDGEVPPVPWWPNGEGPVNRLAPGPGGSATITPHNSLSEWMQEMYPYMFRNF